MEEGRGIQHGGLHAGGGHTGDIRQLGGSRVGASIMMAMDGRSSGTLPVREPPGGMEQVSVAEVDEVWY